MGQEHSVPSPRNRLSKPKTNNSTLNLLSKSALHLDRKDASHKDLPGHENQYGIVFADPDVTVDPVKEDKPKKESKRRSIFRSYSTPDKNLAAREEKKLEPELGENQVYQWGSTRKQSTTEEVYLHEDKSRPANVSRTSFQHVPASTSQQRLSFVAEVLTPSEELPNRLSTYAQLRSPQLTNPVFTRTSSETDLYPVRRRSLLQHGVATRPVVENDARQSLPSQARHEVHYNYSKPSPYPLAYLNSLQQADMPRVETPDDVGYRHTGAYKLGSLVITNGVASPTPSVERASTMGAGEDYISAGHLRRLKEGHQRGASSRSNTMTIPGERMKAPWVVHEESPLRQAEKYENAVSPKLPDLDRSLANFDFDYTLNRQIHSPTRSQDLADEYIAEISSPYSFVPSRTPSPRLEATSKHTALDDELFDAEPLTPALSHAPSTADSGYGAPSRNSSAVRQKPLAKADSGYSSNISLRSFKANGLKAPPVPAKDLPQTPPSSLVPRDTIRRVPSTSYSYNSFDENIVKTKLSLPVLSTDYASFNNPSTLPLTSEKSYPPRTPTNSNEQVRYQQEPELRKTILIDGLRSNPNLTDNQKHSRSGSDPKSLGVAKLLSYEKEKTRPYSLQPEMSQIFTQSQRRDEPINAPPVPYETSRSLEDRVDSFPTISFNPFKGFRRSGSKETLGTIFSVGSGYTDVPRGQELTKSRLQEALPSPPTALRKALSNSTKSANVSIINSNSYCPPKTPPRKLQKRSSVQDMVAYQQLDLSVTKKPSYSSIRSSVDENLRIVKRSESMTSEIEETGNLTTRKVSGNSTATVASTVLSTKQSYGSIAARNPYDSRKSSLDTLPSRMSAPTVSDQHLNVDNEPVRRLSWGNRDKKQPPVSMQTQRKVTPIPKAPYNVLPSPPRRPHPIPLSPISKDVPKMASPERAPPPPPKSPLSSHHDSPRPDPWADQTNFWSERRNSANSLQQERPILTKRSSTSSIQPQRPSLPDRNSTSTLQSRGGRRPPSVHQNSNLRIQKNIEVVKARIYSESQMYMQSTRNLQHYQDRGNEQQREAEEQARQNGERDRAGEMLAGWAVSPGGTTPGEYHHTYGFQASVARSHSPEKEYFSQHEEVDFYGDFHQRQNSTADMLMLDHSFSGGSSYGYESVYGLGGSGGTRNTGSRGQRRGVSVGPGY